MNACVHARSVRACRFGSAVRIAPASSNLSRKWTRKKKTHRFINHSGIARKKRVNIGHETRLDPLHSEFAFVPLKWHIFAGATNTDRVEAAGKKKKKNGRKKTRSKTAFQRYTYVKTLAFLKAYRSRDSHFVSSS